MAYNTIKTDKHLDLAHAEQVCDTAIANGYQSIAVATSTERHRAWFQCCCRRPFTVRYGERISSVCNGL